MRGAVGLLRRAVASAAYRHRRWRRARWVATRPNRSDAPRSDLRLFAILGTWMEEDIVEATVRNALTQGCERIFLLDNGSPDATVDRAVAAGAEFLGVHESAVFRESERTEILNRAMAEISEDSGLESIWWLRLDADEFPHGPDGRTIRDYLSTLDRSFRVVGSATYDHYPTTRPEYEAPFHPVDYQPQCTEHWARSCRSRHWKHPLLRWEVDGPHLRFGNGAHVVLGSTERLTEPSVPVFTHHVPFRVEAVTRERFRQLEAKRLAGSSSSDLTRRSQMLLRIRHLDHVYAGRFDLISGPTPALLRRSLKLRPWSQAAPSRHLHFHRWYPPPNSAR